MIVAMKIVDEIKTESFKRKVFKIKKRSEKE